jgi:hypothetical protein
MGILLTRLFELAANIGHLPRAGEDHLFSRPDLLLQGCEALLGGGELGLDVREALGLCRGASVEFGRPLLGDLPLLLSRRGLRLRLRPRLGDLGELLLLGLQALQNGCELHLGLLPRLGHLRELLLGRFRRTLQGDEVGPGLIPAPRGIIQLLLGGLQRLPHGAELGLRLLLRLGELRQLLLRGGAAALEVCDGA